MSGRSSPSPDPVLRQAYVAGERCFVDYAGQTLAVVDPSTGELREAEFFVGALGASNCTFAELTWTRQACSGLCFLRDSLASSRTRALCSFPTQSYGCGLVGATERDSSADWRAIHVASSWHVAMRVLPRRAIGGCRAVDGQPRPRPAVVRHTHHSRSSCDGGAWIRGIPAGQKGTPTSATEGESGGDADSVPVVAAEQMIVARLEGEVPAR